MHDVSGLREDLDGLLQRRSLQVLVPRTLLVRLAQSVASLDSWQRTLDEEGVRLRAELDKLRVEHATLQQAAATSIAAAAKPINEPTPLSIARGALLMRVRRQLREYAQRSDHAHVDDARCELCAVLELLDDYQD